MSWFNDLIVRIKGDSTHLDATLSKTETGIKGWAGKIGTMIAGAFAVAALALAKFSSDAIRAAAEVEGIKNAFAALGVEGTAVLENMKRATRGVIQEDELMRLAIRAKSLGIPFRDLGTYMTFATNQAIRLGKPVQQFADLMINSVGRGSARGMYQMGIATDVATAAFKEQGGMVKVVSGMLTEMGNVTETTELKMQRLATASSELKQAWGTFLNKSETIGAVRQYFTDLFTIWADERLTFWQKMNGSPDDYKKFLAAEEQKMLEAQGKNITSPDWYKGAQSAIDQNTAPARAITKTLQDLKDELSGAQDDLLGFYETDTAGIQAQLRLIEDLKKKIETLMTIPVAKHGTESLINVSGGMGAAGIIDLSPIAGIKDQLVATRVPIEKELTNWQNMWQEAKMGMVENAADMVEGLFTAVTSGNWDNFGKDLLMGFANFLSILGKQMIALAIAEAAFMKTLANPAMWPFALAAGLAAVAAAGLIKGTLSGGTKSITGGSGGGGGAGGQAATAGTQKLIVEGVIRGRDIYITNKRYGDEIGRNT